MVVEGGVGATGAEEEGDAACIAVAAGAIEIPPAAATTDFAGEGVLD